MLGVQVIVSFVEAQEESSVVLKIFCRPLHRQRSRRDDAHALSRQLKANETG